jgi:light-regulated signal transduction histidine kinase (bacteriophytochrome)
MITSSDHDRLLVQTSTLEANLADQTRELENTVKELESFTYSVAHDLRAPLRAISSFSRILLEDYAERFQGEPLDYLQRIVRSSERMSCLIDDLLKLSRIGRGEVERRSVDLSAIVTEITLRLHEQDDGRKVQFDIQDGVTANGDARLLAIAFDNLLGNAHKFTRRSDVAVIRFFTTEHEGRPIICVADNGVGFDMRYRNKLFAPFQRLHRDDEFEGTGIGLVTVSRIIARHGGEVWIDGAPGKGATVSLFIPPAGGTLDV